MTEPRPPAPASAPELVQRYAAGERAFAGAQLAGAELAGQDLSGADLSRAELTGADLAKSTLRGCRLDHADLSGASLWEADLSGADLTRADLTRADLSLASGTRVVCRGANMTSARLWEADLPRIDLSDARLEGASLERARLEEANLRGATSYRLDDTLTRGARFSPNARDPWSVLRRNYSGPRLLFHLLLLVAFFLPYVGRTAALLAVNRGQESVASMKSELEALEPDHPTVAQVVSRIEVSACMAPACQERPVWALLIGLDKGWTFWLPASLIALYNLLRLFLTWKVGPMREEEERSGYSPAWSGTGDREGYAVLFRAHQALTTLLVVAIVSFVWNAWHWLTVMVSIPA